MKLLAILIFSLLTYQISLSQCACGSIPNDHDCDCLDDQVEQALASKFAPEWRFSKKTKWSIIDGSNQNINEENYPCSVDYLIYGNSKTPKLQFYNGTPLESEHPFTDINAIASMVNPITNMTSSDPLFDENCAEGDGKNPRNALTLSFDDNLPGEPNSFPTYYHCGKLSNTTVSITYFLFSAFDNKHEFGASIFANHRGDWEQFSIVIDGLDLANGKLNGTIAYFKFTQHGDTPLSLSGSSNRLRFEHETHPKMYVALTSHAIYPEPGILFDRRIPFWFDLYDDIFLGNGLIVQAWLPERSLINLGEKNAPMPNPNTKWVQYKGRWGGSDSPFGPSCKWSADISRAQTWEQFTQSGYLEHWNGIQVDCNPKFSTNYVPSPNYACSVIVDCRKECEEGTGSDLIVYANFLDLLKGLAPNQTWQVGVMPCSYPHPLIINQSMVLKAIEGKVTIGR